MYTYYYNEETKELTIYENDCVLATISDVEKMLKIIDYNWSDFEGKTAILIEVEGTKCLTWITDEFTPIECAEKVFPFDEKQIYPQQRAEMKICFKRYY